MIKSVSFDSDYRVFKKGDTIEFLPGLNLLVGDQGSGKSSLLGLIRDAAVKSRDKKVVSIEATETRVKFFDFEKDNPRVKSHMMDGDMGLFQMHGMFRSHGEVMRAILDSIPVSDEHAVYLMDEPDMGLSPRSVRKLVQTLSGLVASQHQVLAAVHNPILIESVERVYNLEAKTWMTGEAYLDCDSNKFVPALEKIV
ncbi:MAG: AAA family ATPase [Parcubacteria group bacterium]